jgi:hypothetical protein
MIGCNKKSSSSPFGEFKKKLTRSQKGLVPLQLNRHGSNLLMPNLSLNFSATKTYQHSTCMLGIQNLRNGALPPLARL